MSKGFVLCLCFVLVLCACKKQEPEETFFRGKASIGASDASYAVTQYVAKRYSDLYPEAQITVWRHTTQALLDSLVNGRAAEVLIDRSVSSAESAAFTARQSKLFTYPVAHYPIYLLVQDCLSVNHLDSAGLRRILEGQSSSWSDFGGADVPIRPYAPLPGDGAWDAIDTYFGGLDSVTAVVCSTNSSMVEDAMHDPGALLIYGLKLEDARGFKKLRWMVNDTLIAANAKSIMDSLRWPFMTTFTYATTHMKSDVAAGFLTFLVSNDGQKMVMREGYRPVALPVRLIKLPALDGGSEPEAE